MNRRRDDTIRDGTIRDNTIRVGLLGCGHVGAPLVRLIDQHAELIEARAGVRIEIVRVAVRNLARERDVPLPSRATGEGWSAASARVTEGSMGVECSSRGPCARGTSRVRTTPSTASPAST